MSRIDYLTIGIVAVCILAILFLVYKMTDLFGSDNGGDNIESVQDSVELDDEGIYDYELDNPVDSSELAEPATDEVETTRPAITTPAEPAAPEESTETTTEVADSYSGGKFMVFGGTFTKKVWANDQVSRLKKLGYQNASIEIFDRGKYAVVLVDRFDYMADAERLVKKLEADGIKSYIKMKEK